MNNKRCLSFLAGGLGSGYFPKAPGTCGSIAAVFFWMLIFSFAPATLFLKLLLAGVTFIAGMWIVNALLKDLPLTAEDALHADPSWIVIDEWAGVFVTLSLTDPGNLLKIALAFALFRFFDILKPGPVHAVERLGGASGVMIDDVVAGVFGLVLLEVIDYLIL